jgi:glucosamine--fructose-6-phosphate aminotransferase (isomerizing)
MCGIVGVVGREAAAPRIFEALKRLEYRGYDSAGIATLVEGRIERRRAEGKLERLATVLDAEPLPGTLGVGHTRWATHGAPTTRNAHPHGTARVVVVHNGIIENHAELKTELQAKGQVFETETDTETFARLVDQFLIEGMSAEDAAAAALKRVHGAFALAMIFAGREGLLICARQGAPLAVGFGEGEMYVGSDALALAPLTRRIAYLEEGDHAILDHGSVRFFDANGAAVQRAMRETSVSGAPTGKGNHRHFMEKELHEHPVVLGDTLSQYLEPTQRRVVLPPLPFDPRAVPRLTITACGSAFLAGLVGRYWIEQLARIPVDADVASELRYRDPPLPEGGAAILVSQSGETADTMAALKLLRERGQKTLAIVNVAESSMARESDGALLTVAGPEIGVASTKAFTAQLAVLAGLAIGMASARGHVGAAEEARLTAELLEVPAHAAEVLERHPGAQILFDVKCTRNLGTWIRARGGQPLMCRTGHSLVKAKLRETGAPLAGEMSGHIFYKDRWYGFDDGLYAGARLLEILSRSADPGAVLEALPDAPTTPELHLKLAEGENFTLIEAMRGSARFPGATEVITIDGLRVEYPDGFGLARASNTTPVVVMRFEADTSEALARIQAQFRDAICGVKSDAELPF